MSIEVKVIDYSNPSQAEDLVSLLDQYAQDEMGGGEPLKSSTRANLANALSKLPHAFSIICYVEGKPAGLANCFEGFSTFSCKPLINIHDLVVAAPFRGQGISHKLLMAIEEVAKQKGCTKITLEVLEGNKVARASYQKFGFSGYELDPQMGNALFWQKSLS